MSYSGKHQISPGGSSVPVTDEAVEKTKAMITLDALRAGDRLPLAAQLAAGVELWPASSR